MLRIVNMSGFLTCQARAHNKMKRLVLEQATLIFELEL